MSGAPPDPRGECPETPADDDDVSRLLAMDVTPTSELAAVASARGFRDAATRARAWPKLLALDVTRADASAALFEGRATALNARERNQVELDVRRSHWIPASAGAEQRARLSRVIRGVLATHPGECRYYQGLHDVAAVLLLVCGDAAPAVLDRLVVGHLRDAVRGGGLDTVLETLRLLPHLIAVADPELHAAVFPASTRSAFAESKRSPGPKIGAAVRIPSGTVPERDARDAKDAQNSTAFSLDARDASTASTETENTFRTRSRSESSSKTAKAESSRDERLNPNGDVAEDSDSDSDSFELLSVADFSEMEHVGTCHFAVSWLLTWFAHSLDRLEDVSRLFDAFLSSDPLMPLYVGAAAVVADRETLLAMARGEMDENGDYVVEAEKDGKKKSRAMNRAEDWPLIEGMLHTRLSVLPALGGGGSLQKQKSEFKSQTTPVVRVRWKVVEAAGEDGGFRAAVAVRLVVEERKNALRVPEKKKTGVGRRGGSAVRRGASRAASPARAVHRAGHGARPVQRVRGVPVPVARHEPLGLRRVESKVESKPRRDGRRRRRRR
uniref:Rab-GAP TBC domain-containing protein n=1 Tax=Micromonas pusilla TaxID=38833 RepID=A0A7S0DCU1_MICPS